jgi:hypothetical protein
MPLTLRPTGFASAAEADPWVVKLGDVPAVVEIGREALPTLSR